MTENENRMAEEWLPEAIQYAKGRVYQWSDEHESAVGLAVLTAIRDYVSDKDLSFKGFLFLRVRQELAKLYRTEKRHKSLSGKFKPSPKKELPGDEENTNSEDECMLPEDAIPSDYKPDIALRLASTIPDGDLLCEHHVEEVPITVLAQRHNTTSHKIRCRLRLAAEHLKRLLEDHPCAE